ncbi:FKBP-type peptidyl-prolyl cis-trans isomerase [Flaviramulus sp. BrNp1-15]|uniref:FKBP-type peptidyl-prolyl cis-trans isomerase n=1 Tax=Flaviramulus sp. BrNp1-15 TaxID=2916754 RepID=UPI001EE97ED9|nr:FKBP-type peptidyl-prolyl cis-trans isomerase [Flaviramulus sp. BrNp1-15]ULC59181.1 FKBP-type peptidyl-prolyl cis-trans isomerase [Flaviramulus sp. BrNp1-15]
MKFLSLITLVLLVVSCNKNGVSKKPLKTELDSVSYAIGMDVAKNVKKSFDDEFDNDLFIQGFLNASDSTDIMIEETKAQQLVRAYFQKKQQEEMAKRQEEAKVNKEEGDKFLAENKSKDGVVTTESGLQYIVLKEGTGPKPAATDKVKLHYHGTLIDGTVFDSSVDKGEPITLGANQFIKGFTEGLLLMPVGSKYKLFIPSDIGYGANPRPGGAIKPNSALIFDVELLEIVK